MAERCWIQRTLRLTADQQGLDFGAERKRTVVLGVVERLDADAVSGEEQRPAASIPQGDAEHPAEVRERVLAPLLISVHDRLGIGIGVELVPVRGELRAQLAVVVNLPVEDHPDGSVFVANRLVAAGEVDDAQAAHAERRAIRDEHPLVVWPAVTDDIAHLLQPARRTRAGVLPLAVRLDETRYSAHRY